MAINAWEYFRSASRELVVTRSSGSLARMATSDSPMRSRSLRDSLSIAPMSAPSSDAFSRTEVRTWPSVADTRLAERT